MAEYRGFDILDYFVLLVKWKKFLLVLLFSVFVVSYLTVYFFIDEEFESTALIVPAGESSLGEISGIMKNLKDLPLGLGGKSKNAETDLYITIIYSRSSLETMLKKFNLLEDYKLKSVEKGLKALSKKIRAEVTDENAFRLTVMANSPKKAAEMTNYLVRYLNDAVIQLNVSKSRDNRQFLEERYNEIKFNLKTAEDSLQYYQEKSGMMEAEFQSKLILDAYSKLETQVMTKQMEVSVMEKMVGSDSPQLSVLHTELKEYKNQLENLKRNGRNESVFLPMGSLPEKSKKFLRHYRDVEIYSAMLEFLVPMYEQAKFEEQKNMPVLQVIDYGSVPEKKSYPPRTLFAAATTFVVFIFTILLLLISEILRHNSNPKLGLIRQELKIFKRIK